MGTGSVSEPNAEKLAIASPRPRWFHLTPDRVVLLLLLAECLLWLSDRFHWLPFSPHKGWTVLLATAGVGWFLLLTLLWFVAALLLRFRFQFSIRLLLLFTIAVALPFSWLAVEMKKARQQKTKVQAIAAKGGHVSYDWHYNVNGQQVTNPQPPGPAWLRDLLGDDFFASIANVSYEPPEITDAWLGENVKQLSDLESLGLSGCNVTDKGLRLLRDLPKLRELRLESTHITDSSLEILKELKQLEVLSLGSTKVTNAGLKYLGGLTRLRWLDVHDTQVTDAGMKNLQQALPNCQIYR